MDASPTAPSTPDKTVTRGTPGRDPATPAQAPPSGPPRAASPPATPARHDFSSFYRHSYQGVARALAYTLNDTDLGVEAADEAMARAYLRWSRVADYDNPAGWVYRVGLNWARSAHRRLARHLPFRETGHVTQPPVADPVIEQALRELDVRLRAVVVCRLLLDWSVEDTAAALGVRPGTVKSRLHRSLRQLESRLDHLR